MDVIEYLEKNYGITARDRTLYRDAFTHASYINESREETGDYERLEFIGDAVVEIWVSNKLFHHKPEISEGRMTTMRSQLVCEKSLASFLKQMDLPRFIRLGAGEIKNHGRERESLQADVFEALMGAIYVDLGFEEVSRVLDKVITIVDTPEAAGVVDYKTKLQELVQADSRRVLQYVVLNETGTSNNPLFEIGCYLDDVLMGTGKEHSKKKAEQLAAREALNKLAL
ncbi:MAG: ribonuclease III [Erysipelotrichaceae bacterium]|nr:ribonuclease III [Erysipelotrichaceae bacterium]